MSATDTMSALDRADVIATCIRFAWYLDDRNWWDLESLFGPAVEVDYTDLFGGAATTVSPSDMVVSSRRVLGGLDRTQHLVAGHLVSGDGDQAQCRSQVIATHVYAGARTGDRIWTAGGSYTMGLARAGGDWRIVRLKFELSWSTGNREIIRQSRLDAEAAPSS